jgi:hypothetical protein
MSSTNAQMKPVATTSADDRRAKVMRDLKLALIDEMQLRQSGGFNPYDSREGRANTDRWDRRRR